MGIISLIKPDIPSTLRRMKPVQPPGVFGVHAFATQPPAPMQHLMNVHRAFRECRKRIELIHSSSAFWSEALGLARRAINI